MLEFTTAAAGELHTVEAALPSGDTLPPDHWAHAYCPYLDICEPGQKAMEWQAAQPKSLPDRVPVYMSAKRIVAKKRAEVMTGGKKKGTRSLAELMDDLQWE